jgi:hypothetical protein
MGSSPPLDPDRTRPLDTRNASMKTATVESVCECQAALGAVLDEGRHVVRGFARYRGRELSCPANTLGAKSDTFDIGFMCPFCTRNTLRSFHRGTLVYREQTASRAPVASSR